MSVNSKRESKRPTLAPFPRPNFGLKGVVILPYLTQPILILFFSWNAKEDFITCPPTPYFATRKNSQRGQDKKVGSVEFALSQEEKEEYHVIGVYTMLAAIGMFCLVLCIWLLVLYLKHRRQGRAIKGGINDPHCAPPDDRHPIPLYPTKQGWNYTEL